MKKLIPTLIIAILLLLLPQIVHAQEMKTAGSFTGMLQVSPEGSTVAQSRKTLMFTIDDKSHKFLIDNCNCEVTINTDGKLPYTQKITTPAATTGGLYSVMIPFVFPRGGDYTVTFAGNPKNPDSFTPFKIQWRLSVEPKANEIQTLKTQKGPQHSNRLLISLVVLMVIATIVIILKRKKLSSK